MFVKAKNCKVKATFENKIANSFRYFLFDNCVIFRSYDQSLHGKILVFNFFTTADLSIFLLKLSKQKKIIINL